MAEKSTDISISTTDKRCPLCGTINKHLDLVETDGWMECSGCKQAICFLEHIRIPIPKPLQNIS